MQPRAFVGLDNPVFAGRLRDYAKRPSVYKMRGPGSVYSRVISDIRPLRQSVAVTHHKNTAVWLQKNPHASHNFVHKPSRTQVLKREIVARPTRRKKRKLVTKSRSLVALAMVLFLTGMGVSLQTLRQNQKTAGEVKALTKQAETGGPQADPNVPSENKPSSNGLASYRVAPDLPRILTIAKLNVKARVVKVGLKADNSIQAPYNIYDAGWYEGSAKPGAPGAMFIDGHVHGPTAPGIFVNLKNLKAGDQVEIERGDGTKITYKVVKSQTYDVSNVDMAAALSPVTPGKPGLNLMTCAGKYDRNTKEYSQRLVVFAVQT